MKKKQLNRERSGGLRLLSILLTVVMLCGLLVPGGAMVMRTYADETDEAIVAEPAGIEDEADALPVEDEAATPAETPTEEPVVDETPDVPASEETPAETPVQEETPAETPEEPEQTAQPDKSEEPDESNDADKSEEPVKSNDADEDEESGEPNAVDALYDRLMACETLDEINAILDNLSDEETALMDQFTDKQNAALSAKMEALGAYEADNLESYTVTIPIGDRYSQYKGWDTSNINLSISGAAGFTVQGLFRASGNYQGYAVRVGNSVKDGTYTVVVSYSGDKNGSDTWTIDVTSQRIEVGIYYLKSPTLQPSSNDVNDWGSAITLGHINKRGAVYETAGKFTDKNCYDPTTWILDMPDGLERQSDGSYLVSKDTLSEHWNTIWAAYKASWEAETGLTLTEDDVVGIYLTPYKLSQDNGDLRKKEQYEVDHIDCTVSVKLEEYYGARFWVTKPGEERVLVDSKNYKADEQVQKTTKVPGNTAIEGQTYPETLVVDGVTYKFDGWYNEAGAKVADSGWPYTPNEKELTDGFVDFYAKYVPATYTLTITKEVTGNMGSWEEDFNFTVSGNVAEADKSFTLKHGEKKEISVTVGDTVTVTEANGSYQTTYQIGDGQTQTGNVAAITVSGDTTIAFTNHKEAKIDTGVMLDSLPYLVILAVVVVAAVVVLLRKRRMMDEE